MKWYATRDVADLLGMSEAQVRAHVRAGYLRPARGARNALRFSFPDLVLLRTAKALTDARVPARRIQRALKQLARELPEGRSLAALRITAQDGAVVVHHGPSAWSPGSGQLQLDFNVAELAARVRPLARSRARQAQASAAKLTADDWYDMGFELEAVEPKRAADAYEHALEQEPEHADAHVNLGRLQQEAGDVTEAARHYLQALVANPTHGTAAFNLGTALEDLGRSEEAIIAYRKAIEADDDFAEAHFNLSRLYEQTGRKRDAIRHLKEFKRLRVG